jgi:diacylglycerol kinase family enzyme
MRIVLVTNAASGKGGSHSLAERAAGALVARGHDVSRVALAPGWEDRVGDAQLIVACGGDGTVSAAAPIAAARNAALYHLPRGTENLFAREYGMRADVDQLVRAVGAWNVGRFDLGECRAGGGGLDGRVFVLMCSVGFDADVLHALAARRKGPISHGSYARPVIDCLLRPTIRTLTIEVDGCVVVDSVKGNVVVSNCGRYALGMDPSRDASMTDGELDVFFAPSASSARTVAWMGMAMARMGRISRSIVRARGARVAIGLVPRGRNEDSRGAGRYQLDGEAVAAPAGVNSLEMSVRRGVLAVVRPG